MFQSCYTCERSILETPMPAIWKLIITCLFEMYIDKIFIQTTWREKQTLKLFFVTEFFFNCIPSIYHSSMLEISSWLFCLYTLFLKVLKIFSLSVYCNWNSVRFKIMLMLQLFILLIFLSWSKDFFFKVGYDVFSLKFAAAIHQTAICLNHS